MSVNKKKDCLMRNLSSRPPLLISYSGGLDSSLLCFLANQVPGKRPLCILLDSPLVPRRMISRATRRAEELGYEFDVVRLPILEDSLFRKNPKNRCYICKKLSAKILKDIASSRGFREIADGVNASDLTEFRPGLAACDDEGIIHPFVECEISKDDIRSIARDCGLSFWNEPSGTCLATRIPYDQSITPEILDRIEAAEEFLLGIGFEPVRVRFFGDTAKIEVMPDDLSKLISLKDKIIQRFHETGFARIVLDLEGYRSGSMDEPA
jgi:uncharacterized protein